MSHFEGLESQPPPEPQELGLKHLSEEQLFKRILESGKDWDEDQRAMVIGAYNLAKLIHKDDTHRDKPYTYHLLRNASRITEYFDISDPEIIAGEFLHDGVEDHPKAIIRFGDTMGNIVISEDPLERQHQALGIIERLFSTRTAAMVDGMTNPPKPEGLTQEEKFSYYCDHVEAAIQNPDVFIGKLSDWADNGLGIVHSTFPSGSSSYRYFGVKYGNVVPILEARYWQDDIQALLTSSAKANIEHMFQLAKERLVVT